MSALAPQGPGCSISSHVVAVAAVPGSGLVEVPRYGCARSHRGEPNLTRPGASSGRAVRGLRAAGCAAGTGRSGWRGSLCRARRRGSGTSGRRTAPGRRIERRRGRAGPAAERRFPATERVFPDGRHAPGPRAGDRRGAPMRPARSPGGPGGVAAVDVPPRQWPLGRVRSRRSAYSSGTSALQPAIRTRGPLRGAGPAGGGARRDVTVFRSGLGTWTVPSPASRAAIHAVRGVHRRRVGRCGRLPPTRLAGQ